MPEGVKLVKPPKVSSKRPMSDEEFYKTTSIAESRIVVEMVMERAKNYRILQFPLHPNRLPIAQQIVFNCFALTNLLPPLLTPAIDIDE